MKKLKNGILGILLAVVLLFNTSCATILLQGKATTCQKTKPAPGQPQREVRVGYLIADLLLFWPFVFIDFATAEIYKPCK